MQQQQPRVMQTSPLQGYEATTLSAALAFSAPTAFSCRGHGQFLFTFEST